MREFYNFVDGYITNILIDNLDISKQLKNVNDLEIKLKSADDILLFNDNELRSLLNYLVIDKVDDIIVRIKEIRINKSNEKNINYLFNLYKEIKERFIYLKDSLNYKLNNNKQLLDRVYYIYNSFKDGNLVGEIVDFNMLNKLLYLSNFTDDRKKEIIDKVSENNLRIYKDRQLVNRKYYLSLDEYNLFHQCLFLVNNKSDLLKKQFSLNYNNIEFYNLYRSCLFKLDEISICLNDVMAANNLFETCGNANERRMLLNDKNDIFNKLEKLLNQYYELEESIVNEFEEEVNDNLDENKDNIEVIYLTKGHNGEGNVVFLDYLKGIPFEYYGKLLSMLESIYKKSNTDNLANNKVLVGPLKGLWERKAFKLRIYYKKLSNNNILVLFCDTKKSNETLAKDRYLEMLSNWEDEINYIENIMSGVSIEKAELIKKNKIIHEQIVEYMSVKGRNLK